MSDEWSQKDGKKHRVKIQGVGFEPTPPKRILPESTALDHSATLASNS